MRSFWFTFTYEYDISTCEGSTASLVLDGGALVFWHKVNDHQANSATTVSESVQPHATNNVKGWRTAVLDPVHVNPPIFVTTWQ